MEKPLKAFATLVFSFKRSLSVNDALVCCTLKKFSAYVRILDVYSTEGGGAKTSLFS